MNNTGIKSLKLDYSDLPSHTIEEWERWEGDWELIEGVPYAMSPMPRMNHQRVNGKLLRFFSEKLENCKNCEAFLPINLKLNDKTVVHPDLVIVCEAEEGVYLTKIPELAIEIISPSSEKHDTITKPKIYQQAGIRYYILVHLNPEKVEVFELKDEKYELQLSTVNENFTFYIKDCVVKFDFSLIW